MKKRISAVLALALFFASLTGGHAFALKYQQHFGNEATFETLEEAHENGPAAMAALTGRAYMPDPALDEYPQGTTFVYRSAGMYTSLSAAYRMNTNLMVFTPQKFAEKADALAFLQSNGMIDIADQAHGSIVLMTPIDAEKGFGAGDQYAYFRLQSAMCNLGFSVKTNDKVTYYADNAYFGGLTYRYVIAMDEGATFVNNYIATTLDNISRVAGMLLYGGQMADISRVAGMVPVYLVNARQQTIDKYMAANETTAEIRSNGVTKYFNQERPQQAVCIAQSEALTAELIRTVYEGFLVNAMRVPVLKAGVNNGNMLYGNYNFNQAPYTLSRRVPIVGGRTNGGITVLEKVDDRFSSMHEGNGEYLDTWYEFLPDEVLDNTAPKASVPLWLANHGGGDDPVQFVDEIGLLELAEKEKMAIVAAENQSISSNIRCQALPALVQYMLETYPALDPARVYVTGYSMGGGCTFNAMCGMPSLFAAGVPMAAVTYHATEEQEKAFEKTDLPVLLLTSTYDYFYDTSDFTFRTSAMCDYPSMLNDYLRYNEMPQIDAFDFETYPLHGFAESSYRRITLNNEYTNHTWLMNNRKGVPMVGLTVTEFLPHGLYPEYAKLAWDFCRHYTRNVATGEVVYHPDVQ